MAALGFTELQNLLTPETLPFKYLYIFNKIKEIK